MSTQNGQSAKRRHSQKGNVFFTLFGAVAIVGLLGAVVMSTLRGPLATMVAVNQHTQAEAQMSVASKLVLQEAVDSLAGGGDCDGDGFVEPLEFKDPGGEPAPTGGGLLPDSVGSEKQDPWGTKYGYCVWDAGTVVDDPACNDGGAINRLDGDGTNSGTYTMIAIISAGPNQTFETNCTQGPPAFAKGGDDLVSSYDYVTATAASGGLWSLKPADPSKAQIAKDLEVTGGASFTNPLDLTGSATAQLKLGAASMLIPDQVTLAVCNAANAGLIRVNKVTDPNSIEICDDSDDPVLGPFTWQSIAAGASVGPWTVISASRIYFGAAADSFQVGINNDNPAEALDVKGNIQLTNNLKLANAKSVVWASGADVTENAGKLEIDAAGANGIEITVDNDAVAINGNTTITGSTTGVTAVDALTVEDSAGADILVVQNDGNVGIGDASPVNKLSVSGNIDTTAAYKIDNATVLNSNSTMADTILVGKAAGASVTGDDNTVVGAGSAVTLVAGERNILLGNAVDVPAAGTNDYLNIGDVIHGDIANKRIGIGFADTYDVSGFNNALEVNGSIDATADVNAGDDLTSVDDVLAGDDVSAVGDVISTGGIVVSHGTVKINDTEDLEPLNCTSAQKLEWNGAWSCVADQGAGAGGGGESLEDVLAVGNNANTRTALNLGGVAIGSNTLSTGGSQDLELDVTGDVGATNYCDAAGNNCFTATGVATAGLFEINTGVVRTKNALAPWTSSDFVFGSPQLADDADPNHYSRMWFDKSKAAFRAGSVSNVQWDDANVGSNSTAFGASNAASGDYSTALSFANIASGNYSTVWGYGNTASGNTATAFGLEARATGARALAIGFGDSTGATSANYPQVSGTGSVGFFMGDQVDVNMATGSIFGLLGGRMVIDPNTPATQTNVSTGAQQLELDVEGDVGAINYCDKDGNNCFTPSQVAGGSTTRLSGLLDANAANSISSADHAQTWNWTLTTAAKSGMEFGEAVAATNGLGAQSIVKMSALVTSSAMPLWIDNAGNANSFKVDSGSESFVIDAAGNTAMGANASVAGDLTITGDDLFMATNTSGYILVADGTNYNPVAMSGDATIDSAGAVAIGADKITEAMLKAVNGATDEYCLTYEATVGDFEWQACGSAGVRLSALTAANAANTITANNDYAQAWKWTLTTAAKSGMEFGEQAAATNGVGAQSIVKMSTVATSTAMPLWIVNAGAANSFKVDSGSESFVIDAAGNTAMGANADVAGDLSVTGNADITGTLDVGDDVAVATNKFTVNATTGNVVAAGDLTISGDDLFMATNTSGYILVADGTNFNPVAMSGDATISSAGAIAIGADKITEAMLKAVNAPTDEYCLTYESTVGDFEWQTCGGTNVPLSGITAATAANTIASADYAQVWNWALTTAGKSAFTFGEAAGSPSANGVGAQSIVKMSTVATSTAMPLWIVNAGAANSFKVDSGSESFVIDAAGNTAMGANADVAGDLSVTGNADITGTLDVGDDVAVATNKFTVNATTGNVVAAGDLTISGDDLFMGTNTSGHILVADGTNFNPVAMSGDVTIVSTGATTIGADKITEAMLKSVNAPTDEYCLTYESTVGDFEWQSCGGGGSPVELSAILAASAANTIASADYAQVWNWALTTAGKSAFTFGEAAGSPSANGVGAQSIVKMSTVATSTAMPLWIVNAGAANSFQVDDVAGDASPFTIDASGNVSVGGTLGVTGATTLSSTLDVTGNVAVNTNKFTVTAASGNTAVAGTLGVTGATTLSSTLDVTGNVAVNTNKFNVTAASGNVSMAGDLTISGDDLFMATNTSGYILVADGTNFNPVAMSGDATISSAGAIAIGADKITEAMLKAVNAPTDEYCLTYESTVGDFEWQTCGGGGSPVELSAILAASAANTIASADYAQVWNWALTTAGKSAFTFGEAAGSPSANGVGAQSIVKMSTVATSTAMPLWIVNAGAANSFQVDDVAGDASPFTIDASGNVSMGGNAAVAGTLDVTGNVAVNTNKFTVTAASGNTAVAGTLGVTGATTLSSTLDVTGNVAVNTNKFNVTAASGNVSMAGDLTISGDDLFMGTNTSGYILVADGTNFNPVAMSGDVSIISTGATAIGADKITEAMLKAVNGPTDEYCLTYESTVGDFEWQSCTAGVTVKLNSIIAADNTNSIDSLNFGQTWDWSTISTQTAMAITNSGTTLTSGKLLNVTSAGTAFTGTMMNLDLTGSNASNTGTVLKTSITGTSSTGTPLMVTNLGAGLSMRVNDATGDTDTTPFVIDASGKVGIGVASPSYDLSLGGTSARTIRMESNASDTAGNDLTIQAGGAGSYVAPNGRAGGNLILSGGSATTTGDSNIIFNVYNDSSLYPIGRLDGSKMSVALGEGNTASGTHGSIAMGYLNTASGGNSVALGYGNTASNSSSVAIGGSCSSGAGTAACGNTASGTTSIALGNDVIASGTNAFGLSLGKSSADGDIGTISPTVSGTGSFGIFMGDQANVNVTATNTMVLLGGRLVIDPDPTSATNIAASTGTQQLEIDVEGDIGAINYCDKSGNNCFTPVSNLGKLSALTAAGASNTIANANYPQIWNWAQTTASQSGITFGETSAATNGVGAQSVVKMAAVASSTAMPLWIENAGAALSFRVDDVASDTTPFVVDDTGKVGIGVASSLTYDLSLEGDTNNRTIGMERETTNGIPGKSLTISAGGGDAGSTDVNGGSLTLSSGIATGNGSSSILFQTVVAGQGTSSTDRSPATSMTLASNALTLPSGTSTQQPGQAGMQSSVAGMIRYNSTTKGVEVYQGNTAAWGSVVTHSRISTPATGSNYTVPANLVFAIVEVVGPGGGGGGASAGAGRVGTGGGGGGYIKALCTLANLGGGGANVAVTIGSGGTGVGGGGGNNGSANTTFGTLLTGNLGSGGGASGSATTVLTSGGAGGTATNGGSCTTLLSVTGEKGGASVSFGAVVTSAVTGEGGSTPLGYGGGPVTGSGTTGNNGVGYGSGGSGGSASAGANIAGGAGANGVVIITEFLAGPP